MATVSAVSAVVERLDYLLLADGALARCVGDLRDGVVQLRSELQGMASAADSINSMSEELKKKATQLAHDIEDVVESYTRQEAAHEEKSGVRCCLFNCSSTRARSLMKDLHIFSERINEIKHFMEAERGGRGESFHSSISASSNAEPQQDKQLVPTETTRAHGELVLDMEEDRLTLMDKLTDGPTPELSVIAICGMGGVGKTSLARSLYDNLLLVEHFDVRAWATVGKEFQARKILEDILSCILGTSADEIAGFGTTELIERLYKGLWGRRYLVFLDNVWSAEILDTLKVAFPDNHNNSRIVITTRLMDVARYRSAYIHTMQPLNDDQSWELFKLKFSGTKDRGLFPFYFLFHE